MSLMWQEDEGKDGSGEESWLGVGRQQVFLVKLLTLKNQKLVKVLKFSVV